MSKAFISILGTGRYKESRHKFPDGEIGEPVKFVQEACVRKFCKDWTEEDEVRIFLTWEAMRQNWENSPDGKGLRQRLSDLKYGVRVNPIGIPTGVSEREIWEIFNIMYRSFRENEDVIIDITHGFRFIPMLLTLLMNYSMILKKTKVRGIYYAALEGSTEGQPVPILDLKSFVEVHNWSRVAHDFVTYGNAQLLDELVKKDITGSSLSSVEQEIRRLSKDLKNLTELIALCRGSQLIDYNFTDLVSRIKAFPEVESPISAPLLPLMNEVASKIEPLQGDVVEKIIAVADWCMTHQLYQQACTLLQEGIITLVLDKLHLDYRNKDLREVASSAFKIKNQQLKKESWSEKNKEYERETENLLALPLIDMLKGEYEMLSSIRNDVNHAGYDHEARSVEKIKGKLHKSFDSVKKALLEHKR